MTSNSQEKEKEYLLQQINLLDDGYQRLWNDFWPVIEKSPGSSFNHQNWAGGYIDHLQETFVIADQLYNLYNQRRPLDFSLEDVQQVLFVHDLEKPFKYADRSLLINQQLIAYHQLAKNSPDRLKEILAEQYCLPLTLEHWNAIKYIHGEGDDYSGQKRVSSPLAAFSHICDYSSARIWFDYPK
jgi:hypothetical protein